jgi:hypothetical protein
MNKLKKRFRRWMVWKKSNSNGKLYQILVLLGFKHSPSFGYTLLPMERPRNICYENDRFCEVREVKRD